MDVNLILIESEQIGIIYLRYKCLSIDWDERSIIIIPFSSQSNNVDFRNDILCYEDTREIEILARNPSKCDILFSIDYLMVGVMRSHVVSHEKCRVAGWITKMGKRGNGDFFHVAENNVALPAWRRKYAENRCIRSGKEIAMICHRNSPAVFYTWSTLIIWDYSAIM